METTEFNKLVALLTKAQTHDLTIMELDAIEEYYHAALIACIDAELAINGSAF